MAQASAKEGQLILGLTKAAKKDSGIMKLIAVITMIYLPGTFAAVSRPCWATPGLRADEIKTLFSTSFINASLQTNELSLRINSVIQGVSYAVITISLTAITISAAYMWNRRIEKDEEMEMRRLAFLKPSNLVQGSTVSSQSIDPSLNGGFQVI